MDMACSKVFKSFWVKTPVYASVNPIPGDSDIARYLRECAHESFQNSETELKLPKALGTNPLYLLDKEVFCLDDLNSWNGKSVPVYTPEVIKDREVLAFYGHYVLPNDAVDAACLSNWYPAEFKILGRTYSCVEQFLMACKAERFGDEWTYRQIMHADSPKIMKRLGKRVSGFDSREWDKIKYTVVLNGNWAKFSQNPKLSEFLLNTGNCAIAEASKLDTVYGIGCSPVGGEAQFPLQWRGMNLLGFALMEVREELRRLEF